MSLDTHVLECFIAVYETHSFTKAAKRLNRTQPAVSQSINKLERVLGVKLFRRGRALALTPQGEAFISQARVLVAQHHEAIHSFCQPKISGEVSFGLPEDFATEQLSHVLASFSRQHPKIQLNVVCDLTLNLYDRFQSKALDMVLVKMACPDHVGSGVNVWSQPLAWVGDVNVLQPGQPVPLALAPRPCVYRAQALKSLDALGQSWRESFSSPSFAGLMAAVRAGLGISVLPANMVPYDIPVIEGHPRLPGLDQIHVSLLKHRSGDASVNTLAQCVLAKMQS